jgi:peptidyl-prolyl cis-trans isomerase C
MTDRTPHQSAAKAAAEEAAYRYHLLRAASERFQCSIAALEPEQREEAEQLAGKTFDLEQLVLASERAQDIVIPDTQVQQALDAVAKRYDGPAELDADLERNGLDTGGLRLALRRELLFDAVMQRVGANHAPIAETDERLFYELHHERFAAPEQRTARHILITVNDDYDENTTETARARIETIAAKLHPEAGGADPAQRFARLARRHSECPTAMEGGKLGTLPRGKLYPELDAALFDLDEGTVSEIVESPIGLHLLFCERIHPARTLAFSQVRARIHAALEERRRRDAQRAWLATLRQARAA